MLNVDSKEVLSPQGPKYFSSDGKDALEIGEFLQLLVDRGFAIEENGVYRLPRADEVELYAIDPPELILCGKEY